MSERITFIYTNHRGETRARRVLPLSIWFGSTEWYPEPQWLLRARCLDHDAERDFALEKIKDIKRAAI